MTTDNIFKPISMISLSVRTANVLKEQKIKYLGDLVQHTKLQVSEWPALGKKSLLEIETILKSNNLKLGTKISDWPPKNIHYKANKIVREHHVDENPLDSLSDKYQDILMRRTLGETLEEIGQTYSVTRERIRQIESKTYKILQHPSSISYFKKIINDNKNFLWEKLSNSKDIIYTKNLKNIVDVTGDKRDYLYDLSLNIIYGKGGFDRNNHESKEHFIRDHFNYLDKYQVAYTTNLSNEEIKSCISKLENLFKSIMFPNSLDNVFSLCDVSKNVFSFCIQLFYLSEKFMVYKNYIFPNTTRVLFEYSAREKLTKKLIDVHVKLSTQGIVTYKTARKICSELDAVKSYKSETRDRTKDLIHGFDRINLNHLYIRYKDSFLALNAEKKLPELSPDIENERYTKDDIELDDELENISSKETYDNAVSKIYRFINEEIKESKIISVNTLLNRYAHEFNLESAGQGAFIFHRLLEMINDIDYVAPGLIGYIDFNYDELIIDNYKNIFNIIDSYALDAISWTGVANEKSLYSLLSPKFERYLCKYLSEENRSDLPTESRESFFYSINPCSWDATDSVIDEWENRKQQSSFSLHQSIPRPKPITDKKFLENINFYNLIRIAIFALSNKKISCLSANKVLNFSLLKFRYTSTHLAVMSAAGLLNAPDSSYMSHGINFEILEEFCKLSQAEIMTHQFNLKDVHDVNSFGWNTDAASWLREKFDANLNQFKHQINWVTLKD